MNEKKIRVFVVDDSVTKRDVLCNMIDSSTDLKVVGTASDGEEAIPQIQKLSPDVVTMDIMMPRMNGLEATKKIMMHTPVPIVIVSTVTASEIWPTLDALRYGALDIIPVSGDLEKMKDELIKKIRIASRVKVVKYVESRGGRLLRASHAHEKDMGLAPGVFETGLPAQQPHARRSSTPLFRIVAVGVSTGGPTALLDFLKPFPKDFPGSVLIVQHMVAGFTNGLAQWLDKSVELHVVEAQQESKLEAGIAFIAPGDFDMQVTVRNTIHLTPVQQEAVYKPSADILFQSVAQVFGNRTLGVILTGMGRDGSEGVRTLKAAGGIVLAQDESSCVVYGMPKAAIETGCVDHILPLRELPYEILSLFRMYVRRSQEGNTK